MLDQNQRPNGQPAEDDLLTPAKAIEELGGLVHGFTQTTAERLEHLVRRGAIKPGVRGENGRVRYRRGDLQDATFEFYFHGRKREGRRAAS